MVILLILVFVGDIRVSPPGLALAVTSGAVTSGLGYVAWYAALRGLSGTRAATVQLSVPVIAAIGGVLLLAEPITLRLLVASAATLGGVWIVLIHAPARRRRLPLDRGSSRDPESGPRCRCGEIT